MRRLNLGQPVVLSDGDVGSTGDQVCGARSTVKFSSTSTRSTKLDDVERRYPADHYVIVDDKIRILDAIKRGWENRVTTVFLRQGHYATDVEAVKTYSPADLTLERIDELVDALMRADILPNR